MSFFDGASAGLNMGFQLGTQRKEREKDREHRSLMLERSHELAEESQVRAEQRQTETQRRMQDEQNEVQLYARKLLNRFKESGKDWSEIDQYDFERHFAPDGEFNEGANVLDERLQKMAINNVRELGKLEHQQMQVLKQNELQINQALFSHVREVMQQAPPEKRQEILDRMYNDSPWMGEQGLQIKAEDLEFTEKGSVINDTWALTKDYTTPDGRIFPAGTVGKPVTNDAGQVIDLINAHSISDYKGTGGLGVSMDEFDDLFKLSKSLHDSAVADFKRILPKSLWDLAEAGPDAASGGEPPLDRILQFISDYQAEGWSPEMAQSNWAKAMQFLGIKKEDMPDLPQWTSAEIQIAQDIQARLHLSTRTARQAERRANYMISQMEEESGTARREPGDAPFALGGPKEEPPAEQPGPVKELPLATTSGRDPAAAAAAAAPAPAEAVKNITTARDEAVEAVDKTEDKPPRRRFQIHPDRDKPSERFPPRDLEAEGKQKAAPIEVAKRGLGAWKENEAANKERNQRIREGKAEAGQLRRAVAALPLGTPERAALNKVINKLDRGLKLSATERKLADKHLN